jgi:hypothetical protein
MLTKVALVLLAVWVVGLFGLMAIGDFVHLFLLIGLMLLLLAFLKSRDDAARATPSRSDIPKRN